MDTLRITPDVEVSIVSDLYHAGYTEDGESFVAERFFVQVTVPRGDRYRHRLHWNGCEAEYDEEGYPHFGDIRSEARQSAQRLIDAIYVKGAIDLEFWHQDRPAYGSLAYQDYGQADDLAWEKAQG